MLPSQQSPFVLTAITLNGIGSYLHGARLDIRPLTDICGTNGSGKSTWLKVLNLLVRSLAANRLPFGYDVTDWEPDNIQVTNAFYHLGAPEDHARLASADVVARFGSPGTIGLEFRALRDWQGSCETSPTWTPLGVAQELLWLAKCPAGTRLRIRLAHPTFWADDIPTPNLLHHIELEINETFTFLMQGERDPLQRFEDGHERPRRSRPYDVSCSTAFLPDADPAASNTVPLGTLKNLIEWHCSGTNDEAPSLVAECSRAFDARMRQLLEAVLRGYFYIGAVRQVHEATSLPRNPQLSESRILARRHVGASGEHAWLLERGFASNEMRPLQLPPFSHDEIHSPRYCQRHLTQADSPGASIRVSRLWDCALKDARQKLAMSSGEDLSHDVCTFLNALLPVRGLYAPDYLRHFACEDEDEAPFSEDSHEDPEVWYADPEVEHLVWRASGDPASLSSADVVTLNRLLIEQAFNEGLTIPALQPCSSSFEDYVSNWLNELASSHFRSRRGGKVGPWSVSMGERRQGVCDLFLIDHDTSPVPYGNELRSLKRLAHPCFGVCSVDLIAVEQPPRQLSSGFHQLFPMIVQLGLMRQAEIVGIENPEVHLHPSLQLRVTEFLMGHALAGRFVLIETHSDLVMRRLIRGILEEELAQNDVRIYFTDASTSERSRWEKVPIEFQSSALQPIGVDSHGRVSNWPAGFLDDDVRESQRLLDVMYGRTETEAEDE